MRLTKIGDVVMAYNKKEQVIRAGRTEACKAYYGEKVVEILDAEGEYKTKEHDNKNQLEIPFNY